MGPCWLNTRNAVTEDGQVVVVSALQPRYETCQIVPTSTYLSKVCQQESSWFSFFLGFIYVYIYSIIHVINILCIWVHSKMMLSVQVLEVDLTENQC